MDVINCMTHVSFYMHYVKKFIESIKLKKLSKIKIS